MKAHNLKLDDKYFEDVKDGLKNFEIRRNDRIYQEGDILFLHRFKDGEYVKSEYHPFNQDTLDKVDVEHADTIIREIIYIERDYQIDGYVTLGLAPLELM